MEEKLQKLIGDNGDLIDEDEGIQEVFSNALKGDNSDLKIEILKCVLDEFLQYNDAIQEDTLSAFKYMFTDFSILSLYESKNSIDLHLHLFAYVNSANDPFLPTITSQNFVENIVQKMFLDTKGKDAKVFITFQING